MMNQVTCSLCHIKIDELQWNAHLVSMKLLEFCKNDRNGIAMKFFELIFSE